ncbi:MAG: tetratricopeptide repeat protein [Promethearchaeota archaeon]|nr:MAG: tetratricopeptide repeat protein [Candidatus Lokiarchaeota archaeon]
MTKDMVNIGNVFWKDGIYLLKNNNFTQALEKFKKALDFFQEQNNNIGISSSILGIALVNLSLKNYDIALDNFNRGLSIVKEIDYKPGISSFLMNRGLLFQEIRKFDKALKDLKSSLSILEEVNDENAINNVKSLIKRCEKEKNINIKLSDR